MTTRGRKKELPIDNSCIQQSNPMTVMETTYRQINTLAQKLPLTIALLVAEAQNKGINVNLWLNGQPSIVNQMPTHEFCSKFVTLELIIGMKMTPFIQSYDNLSDASSNESIQIIIQLCGCGPKQDDGLQKFIDVDLFLQLCEIRLAFHNANGVGKTSTVKITDNHNPNATKSKPAYEKQRTPMASNRPSALVAERQINKENVVENSNQSRSTSSRVSTRPSTAQSQEPNKDDNYAEAILPLITNKSKSAESSPRGVSHAKLLYQDDTNVPVERFISTLPKPVPSPFPLPTPVITNNSPRPTSVSSRTIQSSSPRTGRSAASSSSSSSAHTSIEDTRSRSRSRNLSRIGPITPVDLNEATSVERLATLKEFVEKSLFEACRQADLYHLLQVSFGFVDNFTFVPPRGVIVEANPRPWISPHELMAAFTQARLKFSDLHIAIVSRLLQDFAVVVASKKRVSPRLARINKKSSVPIVATNVCLPDGRVSAVWLNRYLISLRLAKFTPSYATRLYKHQSAPSSPVEPVPTHIKIGSTGDKSVSRLQTSFLSGASQPSTGRANRLDLSASLSEMSGWKDWKKKKSIHMKRQKVDQFQALLLGAKSDLQPQEIVDMIEKFSILPVELLRQVAELQVKLWRHDYDGRRDFSHVVHKEIEKWETKSNQKWTNMDEDAESQTLSEIKKKLFIEKFDSLILSERTSFQLTKALFADYSSYCKSNHHKNCSPWGIWLQQYVSHMQKKLDKAIELKRHSRVQELDFHKKQSLVASVDELEDKLDNLRKSVKAPASKLLRQLSFDIRKESVQFSRHASPLITSLNFEKYLKKYNLDTSDASIYRVSTDVAFTDSANEAYRRQLQINDQHKDDNSREFQAWLERKSIEQENFEP